MMASCSSDEEFSNAGKKFKGNVTITAEPYTFADGDTPTTLTNKGNTISFAWDDDEAIGVFQVAPTTNIHAKQVLKNGSGNGNSSSFDGADWTLTYGNTYAAYYPYQNKFSETSYEAVPIDMTGQTQKGNNSLTHIGTGYDYMYANATVPNDGNVNFKFKHVASIIMLKLTMSDVETWKSVTLASKSGNKVWVTSAIMNVTTGAVTSKATSSEVTLALNNVSTTASNKTLILYLAVLPTTTGDLTLTAKTADKKLYTATLASKSLVAGKAYQFTVVFPSVDGYENGYAYVDLGLPSGLKWATMNVGATSVTDYGKYYAWGETKAYGEEDTSNAMNYKYNSKNSYTKSYFDWCTYKWCNGSSDSMTKYCADSKYGTVDKKTTLDADDDAAVQNWGGAWRMPTHAEQEELVNNTYWVWTSSYYDSGIAGFIVYAAKSSSDKGKVYYGDAPSSKYSLSDSHIFLPSAGQRHNSSLNYSEVSACYWSSSLHDSNTDYAWYMSFYSGTLEGDRRFFGSSVRAVCK